jgi:hypothetical protein
VNAPYDPARNGREGYDLALRCIRERRIRAGEIAPNPDKPWEVRWAAEGEREPGELDTVRAG